MKYNIFHICVSNFAAVESSEFRDMKPLVV